MTTRFGRLAAAGLAAMMAASPAYAAPTLVGQFSGNECGGPGGFSNCYAYQNGTTSQGQNGGGSPTIFKKNSDGSTDISTLFPTITGAEFTVTYTAASNQLSFTYTPGSGDPVIHYVAINQANYTYLYYDSAPIFNGTITLNTLFPNNPGWSHITFFDTGTPAVPEPATWAMLIGGFGAMGFALRRRPKVAVTCA
ncbi:MAG: PEP-CTERM sorting domain-containing protein [Proteobacteria bacterium]|nr:PEP-CTERM sorting domain-containing protein [Pseudomonadota bacterium]